MKESRLAITAHLSIPIAELDFAFTRSQGPGGQNVNKLSTRVELLFDIGESPTLNDDQKKLIVAALKSRIDSDGVLHIASQRSRSQWQNREDATRRFAELLRHALRPGKKRVKTVVPKGAKKARLTSKKLLSRKKSARAAVRPED